jgi:hypothetical protein
VRPSPLALSKPGTSSKHDDLSSLDTFTGGERAPAPANDTTAGPSNMISQRCSCSTSHRIDDAQSAQCQVPSGTSSSGGFMHLRQGHLCKLSCAKRQAASIQVHAHAHVSEQMKVGFEVELSRSATAHRMCVPLLQPSHSSMRPSSVSGPSSCNWHGILLQHMLTFSHPLPRFLSTSAATAPAANEWCWPRGTLAHP